VYKYTHVINHNDLLQWLLANGCGKKKNCVASETTLKAVNGSVLPSWALQSLFSLAVSLLELSSWQLKVINHKIWNAMFISDSEDILSNYGTILKIGRECSYILKKQQQCFVTSYVKQLKVVILWAFVHCPSIKFFTWIFSSKTALWILNKTSHATKVFDGSD